MKRRAHDQLNLSGMLSPVGGFLRRSVAQAGESRVGKPRTKATGGLERRQFLRWTAKGGAGLALVGGALPTLLAACGSDDPELDTAGTGDRQTTTSADEAAEQARAVVGDVIDFSLTPDGWEGAFGFVTMKLHRSALDGKDLVRPHRCVRPSVRHHRGARLRPEARHPHRCRTRR